MIAQKWRDCFLTTIRRLDYAAPLQAAAHEGKQAWTRAMTRAVVATCHALGWQATARDHASDWLPVARSEYLNIDVMAFSPGPSRWRYPTAVIELENQQSDDYIAYNLWKLLCLHADLRIVYCYRPAAPASSALAAYLAAEVVSALPPHHRTCWQGDTLLVIGSHADAATFPYGFFQWWRLELAAERFDLMV